MNDFSPRFALDIGAYKGEWTKLLKAKYPACDVMMIEPLRHHYGTLKEVIADHAGVQLSPWLLGRRDGAPVTFYEMETGSSVFEEQSDFPRCKTERTTFALDTLLENEPRTVDLIKIDVQGYELEVLAGGRKRLAEAKAVLMEANLVELNKGAPLIADVFAFMTSAGFRCTNIENLTYAGGVLLWQVDLTFVRESSGLLYQGLEIRQRKAVA